MSCCALSLCVCLAAIRWHLRCFHVSMSVWVLVCVRVHPCLIDCLWKHSNDSVSSSWPSPSLLVSVSLTPAFASQMQRSPSSCRVVWSVFAQPSVPASFSPCVESMGSPRRLPRSTALLCVGGKVGTTAHLPPFNLSLYCSWKSESHRSYHYLEIISLIDVLVQCENTREAVVFLLTAFFVPVCLSV